MDVIRLREFRKKRSLSQRDVASMLNISQPHYWSWENGEYYPNAKQILQLCEIFNCTPNDLFGIKGVHEIISAEIR